MGLDKKEERPHIDNGWVMGTWCIIIPVCLLCTQIAHNKKLKLKCAEGRLNILELKMCNH